MESLSNFGDNLSVKSGSRDKSKRHRQRQRHHSGGHAKLRRSSKSRHTATTTASTAATAACKGSSSSGTTGGGPHNSHSVAALHRSHRRIGQSVHSCLFSFVQTNSVLRIRYYSVGREHLQNDIQICFPKSACFINLDSIWLIPKIRLNINKIGIQD